MYEINFLMHDKEKVEKRDENCNETYLNHLLSLGAGNYWFTPGPWANSMTCLTFVKPLRLYLSSRSGSGL